MNITRQMLCGAKIRPYLEAIATLRIKIFQEYPYLYQGEERYELEYLKVYADSLRALALLAWDGDVLAGALTAIPLEDELPELLSPFAGTPYPVERIFYLGELLFHPAYRGRGLGTGMLGEAEEYVRNQDGFDFLTCATVERPEDHPMRPDDFIPIDRFLHRNGFALLPDVVAALHWPELDGVSLEHNMLFWIKKLA